MIGLPLAILVFTSLLPFYEALTSEPSAALPSTIIATCSGPGSFRDSIVNTLDPRRGDRDAGGAVDGARAPGSRRGASPGGWLLDQLATVPLVFPGIVLGVAFLHVFVNLPLPLYGTLLSVIIASSVRYLPYGMRYAYAGVLQIHQRARGCLDGLAARGRRTTFLRVVLPLLGAGAGQLLAVHLPARACRRCRCRSCWSGPRRRSSPSRCSTSGRTAR